MFASCSIDSILSMSLSTSANNPFSCSFVNNWLWSAISWDNLVAKYFKNLISCIASFCMRLIGTLERNRTSIDPLRCYALEVRSDTSAKRFPPQGYFTPTDCCIVRTNPYTMWWDLSAQNPEMWVKKRLLDCPSDKICWLRWSSASIAFLPLPETGASSHFHVYKQGIAWEIEGPLTQFWIWNPHCLILLEH